MGEPVQRVTSKGDHMANITWPKQQILSLQQHCLLPGLKAIAGQACQATSPVQGRHTMTEALVIISVQVVTSGMHIWGLPFPC